MNWRTDISSDYGLTARQADSLDYLSRLLAAESGVNLTAATEPADRVRVHLLDSLSLLNQPELAGALSAVDIGSGAGFPGLPLAIAMPRTSFTLIEATAKKAAFIDRAISALNLENARVLSIRAEEAGRSALRESFDAGLARAVGSMPEVLEYSLPLLRAGGHILLQRGRRQAGDRALAAGVAVQLGGRMKRISPVTPYPGARNLHIWIFVKDHPTPDRFPRRPGIPRKRPLGPG